MGREQSQQRVQVFLPLRPLFLLILNFALFLFSPSFSPPKTSWG
jgi:hypothetical protein